MVVVAPSEPRGIRRRTRFEVTARLLELFWDKVSRGEPDQCWEWRAALRGNGYGCLKHGGHLLSAHVVSYAIHNGEVPPDGHVVMHSCDNRQCVNPAHLSAGSPRQNYRDMRDRGRDNQARGERMPSAKLSVDLVRLIHALNIVRGWGRRRTSRALGVSEAGVDCVLVRHSWRHVPAPTPTEAARLVEEWQATRT